MVLVSTTIRRLLMGAKQLNRLLIDKFPELEKEYHEEVDWQETKNILMKLLCLVFWKG